MLNPRLAFHALLIIGLGGALLSSSILAGATLLLAIAGMVLSARKSLYKDGWDKPKELRLLHFSFWFFVLVSFLSWALEGFDYELASNAYYRNPRWQDHGLQRHVL